MEEPRLVASDVDGTLLDPMAQLTGRTQAALDRVAATGTPFVLVTGRPPRWITSIASAANLTGYAVCANGAVVYDLGTERVVAAEYLDPMLLHDVAHALERVLPGIHVATERTAASALGGPDYLCEPGYANPWGDLERHPAPRAEVLGRPATKLLVLHRELTSEEMAQAALAVLDGVVDVTYSTNRGLLELSAPGVTKAHGLAEVCRRLDLAAADVLAFGDMPNDIEMLRWAGHGVAMANAHPRVIAAADEVTAPNSEDGVAQVLDRWF